MTSQFPPFNLVSRCPKCGKEGDSTDFVPDGTHVVLGWPLLHSPSSTIEGSIYSRYPCSLEVHAEHLHRTCPRCGFDWAEACVEDSAA